MTQDKISDLARQRVTRYRAIQRRMRETRDGKISTYLRAEARERAKQRFAWMTGWLPSIGVSRPHYSAPDFGLPSWLTPRMPSRMLRRVALAGCIGSIPLMALAWVQSSAALDKLNRAIACAETTALFDKNGALIGALPVLPARECAADRHMVTADFDPDTTLKLARAIATIEGEYSTASPWVWGGHDVRGFARKVGQLMGLLPGRGFSSPLLTSIETTMGEHHMGPWRKLVMLITTSRFAHHALRDDSSRERFITTHMPSILRAGTPRAGALGAHLLFPDGRPETIAQYCQLARASGFPIWAVTDQPSMRAADSWATSIGPATAACVRALTSSPEVEAEALAELRASCGETDLCITGQRGPALPSFAGVMPRVMPLTPGGHVRMAIQDALHLSDIKAGGRHQTTLDGAMQKAMAGAVAPALKLLDSHHLPKDACLIGPCSHHVDHAVILAELVGDDLEVRAIDINHHGGLAGWPVFDPATETWSAASPRFGLGSTSKMLLVLAAEQNGIERLCSNPMAGADCADGRWISIRHAVARSDTDAMLWLARQLPQSTRALQDQITAPTEAADYSAFDAAYGIGRSAMTPAQALALTGAILADGSANLRIFKDSNLTSFDLRAAGIDEPAIAASRRVLAAPLVDFDGTLTGIGQALTDRGFTPLFAKSGTHTEAQTNLVRTSTLAFAALGRVFVLHVSVTATETDIGIGDITHADLVPLQRAALNAISKP